MSGTFDNFIVSDCNREAYELCRSVADDERGKFILLYGPSSCGKTHLLNAVKSVFQNKYPSKKMLMASYDDIVSRYVASVNNKNIFECRKDICTFDLLIIDNMQFAAGKLSTQAELFGWFLEMLNSEKSIVIASDKPERYLNDIIGRMKEMCFDRCYLVKMSEPDVSLRMKWLEKHLNNNSVVLSDEMCDFIAFSSQIPFCAIKGFFMKLQVLQSQKGSPLSKNEIMNCINDYV